MTVISKSIHNRGKSSVSMLVFLCTEGGFINSVTLVVPKILLPKSNKPKNSVVMYLLPDWLCRVHNKKNKRLSDWPKQ